MALLVLQPHPFWGVNDNAVTRHLTDMKIVVLLGLSLMASALWGRRA